MAPSLQAQAQLPVVFAFLKRALADDHEAVQAQFTEAGRVIIEKQAEPDVMVRLLPSPNPNPNRNPRLNPNPNPNPNPHPHPNPNPNP